MNIDASDWDTEIDGSKTPVLVDFWHESCIWCKRLDPIYSQLSGELSGSIKFAKLNVLSSQENNQLGARFGVMGTPTLILFCEGKPIETLVGYRPKEALKEELQRMLETYQDCFKQQTPLAN